ncbi:MAG: hypothetical protein ACHQ53_10035 [Polyangiales bacterium]
MMRMTVAHVSLCWLAVWACACGTRIAETTEKPSGHAANDGGSTACGALATRIHVTSFDAGSMVLANDEYHPVVIAPRRVGSLVAWRASADNAIRVASLDASDHPTTRSFLELSGAEVHALVAPDDSGGVLAIVSDDPNIYSSQYCISAATPNNAGHCQKLELVRFDDAGQIRWRSTLTGSLPVDTAGALFVWSPFQHTTRVVWNGTWYGVYFRSATSTPMVGNASEIEMHTGDTLRFVDEGGNPLAKGGWDFGCTNSWSVRLAYDGHFLAGCHSDPAPNALRLAVLDPVPSPALATVSLLEGSDPYRRALGGVVPSASGFWLDYIADENGTLTLRLARVTDTATISQDQGIDTAQNLDARYPFRPYLAAYGAGRLLLGYKSGGVLHVALADAATGALIEGPIATSAPIDQFQDFVSDPNGDVVWAYSSGNSSEIQVVRVAACR